MIYLTTSTLKKQKKKIIKKKTQKNKQTNKQTSTLQMQNKVSSFLYHLIWPPTMKARELLSSVAKNLNSIKHFTYHTGPLIMKGFSHILINLALHHNSHFCCRKAS